MLALLFHRQSHRKVAWLARDGVDVQYEYAGHSFQPLPLPPLLVEAMESASRVAGAGKKKGLCSSKPAPLLFKLP